MASFTATRPKLTAQGKAKVKRVTAAIEQALREELERQAAAYKRLAARYAPSPGDEAQLLSEGVAAFTFSSGEGDRGFGPGGVVGTPAGGRFQRILPMMPMRLAIELAPIQTTVAGSRVTVRTLEVRALNRVTGFSWATRRRGIQGPTLPFNRRYAEALNDGGTWTVRPRTRALLNPEPGVNTGLMVKTLQPTGFLTRARAEVRRTAPARIKAAVSKAMRAAGG